MTVLRRLFAIDPRSLAAFRIAIALVLLVDLGTRAADLAAMYTDDGLLSRAAICRHYSAWNWSFHFGSGSATYQAALFALAGVLALALLLGFQTRLATVASWLMLVSLHNRVPPVLSGADNLARMLLFWGMFLPLGAVGSIDARLERRRGHPRTGLDPVLSVGTAAILLQMGLLYLFSAVFKTNADWLGGKAMAAILRDGFYGTPIGAELVGFPRFLAVLTITILILEWLCPFLLFSPLRTGTFRLWALALLASMHVGVAVLLEVGLFSFVSLTGLLLFLPPSFWERLRRRAPETAEASPRPGAARWTPPRPAPHPLSIAAQGACALALAYVVFANLNGLPGHLVPWKPAPRTELFTVSLGLGQTWDMFASAPTRNGWYVGKATLADGTQVDLLREGSPVSWERPRNPAAIYRGERWRKLFVGMSYAEATGYEVFRQPMAEHLCREWNRGRPPEKQVSDFALVFCMERETEYGPGPTPGPARITIAHLDFKLPSARG